MAYAPEIRTEAYELFIAGMSLSKIKASLEDNHTGENIKLPSIKTLENWAYTPVNGKTWSDRKLEAELAAQKKATQDVIGRKKLIADGLLKMQALLQDRVITSLEDTAGEVSENVTQDIYAYINASNTASKMLDNQLAEQVRRKDAVDCLLQACRRIVPGWEDLELRIKNEFDKLANQKN